LTADQIARFEQAGREKKMIYVTLTQDRPAKLVSIDFKKPDLAPAQACIAARVGHWTEWDKDVSFPQISQYFVPEGEGKLLERNLESLLARVRTTNGCNAVLLGLEPKEMEN
jgi:uncharacterized membrane-anchored protein